MGRWRPLPRTLGPQQRRLVERLRLMKDRTGLSLASLAAKTAYSRSSWQRYLSGDKAAPWPAVDALGRLAGEDRARLRVLWELAAQSPVAGTAVAGTAAGTTTGDGTHPEGSRADTAADGTPGKRGGEEDARTARERARTAPDAPSRRAQLALIASLLTPTRAAAASFTLALLLLLPGSRPQSPPRPEWPWALPSQAAARPAAAPHCRGDACTGRDPRREGCAHGARELGRGYGSVHQVRLLYSPRCRAAWAEVSPAGPGVAVSLSAPGKGLRQARTGEPRTVMIAVTGPGRSIACETTGEEENCVDSGGESWSQ